MGIFLVIVLAVGFVVHLVRRQPDEFRVTRSALLHAEPETVFDHLNDLEKWQSWSPWVKLDPAAKRTFDGNAKVGPGASMSWQSKKTGHGTMTILDSTPVSRLRIKVEFFRPQRRVNTIDFTLARERTGTLVTWNIYGPASLKLKIMGLFINYDKVIGAMYESGLTNLDDVLNPVVSLEQNNNNNNEPSKAA